MTLQTLPLFSNIFGQNRNLLWRFLLGTGVQPGDFHVEINHAELSFLILVWFFVSNDLAIIGVNLWETDGRPMDGQFGKPKGPNIKHNKSIHILTRLNQRFYTLMMFNVCSKVRMWIYRLPWILVRFLGLVQGLTVKRRVSQSYREISLIGESKQLSGIVLRKKKSRCFAKDQWERT